MRNTDFMFHRKWGVFMHFLTDISCRGHESPERWNEIVDTFDTEKLARQLHELQVGWLMLTIGQNSGYYCSPNRTLDRLTEREGATHCSRRDLIADLTAALAKYEIPLFVYLPGGAPFHDRQACEMLGWSEKPQAARMAEFQRKWENIIREWALRWGKSIAGWWIDGCYFQTCREMYEFDEEPNFRSFAAAMRAGNPDALVAWNPGVADPELYTTCSEEDYTAGECKDPQLVLSAGRYEKQALSHVLSYIGEWWGWRNPRFTRGSLADATHNMVKSGGTITWDVPYESDGTIPEEFAKLLRSLAQELVRRGRVSEVTGEIRFHWSALIPPSGNYPTRERPGSLTFAVENTSPKELCGTIRFSSDDLQIFPKKTDYALVPGEKLMITLELTPKEKTLRCCILYAETQYSKRTFKIPVRETVVCSETPLELSFPHNSGKLQLSSKNGRLYASLHAKDDARRIDEILCYESSCLELFLTTTDSGNIRQYFALYGKPGKLYFLRQPEGMVAVADTEFAYRDTAEGFDFELSLPCPQDALLQVALHISQEGKFGYHRLFGDPDDGSIASYAKLQLK